MEPTLAQFEESLVDAIRKGYENNTDAATIQALSNMLIVVQIYRVFYQVFKK